MRNTAASQSLSLAMVALLAAGGAMLSACSFDEDYSGTRYRCDDGKCPGGLACFGGFCEAALAADATCGTINVLAETFSSEALDDNIWSTWDDGSGATVVEQKEGGITVQVPADTDNVGGGVDSRRVYLFQSSSVSVEVPALDTSSAIETFLELRGENGARASISQDGGVLHARYEYDGNDFEPATLPYVPAEHAVWQLREEGGTMYFETSADGKTWNSLASVASTPLITLVSVRLGVWLSTGAPTPPPIKFGVLNGGAATEGWCPSSMMRDDFEDNEIGEQWGTWQSDCTVIERDGGAEIDYAVGASGDCGFYSRRRFDVSGSLIAVEVPKTEPDAISTVFSLWVDDDNNAEFKLHDGSLDCNKEVDGIEATVASVPYNPIEHRWWRFRGDKGALHFEASPDGKVWQTIASHQTPILPMDEAEVDLSAYGPTQTNGLQSAARFDNLNILP